MNILISLAAIILGFLVELYTFQIVRTFGHLDWAERYLGPGGSYSAWRIIGILMIIFGYWNFKAKLF
jgi:hypothetical protein